MGGVGNVTEDTTVDTKRPRDESTEAKEAATAGAHDESNAGEQPLKRARREEQEKCSKCNSRMARRDCSQSACITCCSDTECEGHQEARENAKWKEEVLAGTTQVQKDAKAKRASEVVPGSFYEPGFCFLNQSIEIFNKRKFLANPEWSEDAVRRAGRRKATNMLTSTTKPIRNNVKRFRRVMDGLYRQSLKNEDKVATAAEQVEDSKASPDETIAMDSGGEKAAARGEVVTGQEPTTAEDQSKETVDDEDNRVSPSEDKSKEPVTESGMEEAAVAEAKKETDKEARASRASQGASVAEAKQSGNEARVSQEASVGSDDHEAFPHSAETAVTDDRSPNVDRHDAPSEKEKAVERLAVANAKHAVEEAKGVEEADSSEVPSKLAADQTNVIETSKSGESDETSAKKTDEEAKKPAAKPRKKRKARETDWDASSPAAPLRSRSTRRKASPAPEQEEDPQKEEALKTPAKKRAIARTAKNRSTGRKAAATQPKEEEAENDDTQKKPAKKRARASVRGSARNRTRAAAATPSLSPEDEPVRVLMTAVGETDEHKKMVTTIGAVLVEKVEDAHTATHVIAGDDVNRLRRTPKLMIGMCRTSKILRMDWLTESAKAREPLACNNYLLLKDRKAERRYDFVIRESLQRGDEIRRNEEYLLSGYWVYICKGVAGDKAPPAKELELIIDAAGGTWLKNISTRTMKGVDAEKLIIITAEKKTKTAEAKDVEKAVKNGASSKPASWLFRCIIKQSLDDDE